jgi:DMSO/TMAO reductase YedYZ heme-binding membrane subunit
MLVKKDITEPLIYVAILVVLLGVRVVHDARRTAAAT